MDKCIVEVREGKLRGKMCFDYDGKVYYSFQGIRYAQPPVGDLRFKAPLPAKPWIIIKDAKKEGNVSLQTVSDKRRIIGSEDCLFLNVYTPQIIKSSNDKLRPILFWIHGGSCITGSGNSDLYGPDYFMTENIILVTVNYRLGYLGFLNLEDPDLNVTGNAAMKDVVLALNWVQYNIEAFCGDPNNVTIAGTSSGSAMAHLLMLSPIAKGLFHRVILQSGTGLNTWSITKNNPKRIVEVLGCKETQEKEILTFLQSVPAKSLIEAQAKLPDFFLIHKMKTIGPIIEKSSNEQAVLSEHPVDIIKSGNYNKVPIMIGYNSNEGIISEVMYGNKKPDFNIFDDFVKKIPHFYNIPLDSDFAKRVAEKIKKYFYEDNTTATSNTQKFFDMQTNISLLHGVYYTINLSIQNLEHPIYFYKLSADTNLNVIKKLIGSKHPGACHSDEVGYLFKNIFSPPLVKGSDEERYVRRMVKLWSNFVKTGNPNQKTLDELIDVTWEPVTPDKYNCLDIDKNLTADLNLDVEKMKIWNEISAMNPYESKFQSI